MSAVEKIADAVRPEDARQLFAQLDQIHLVALDPDRRRAPQGRDFGSDIEGALEWAARQNASGLNVYWTVNSVRPGVNKKPSKGDIAGARFAHVDVDPPKDGTAFDPAAVVKAFDDCQRPPSFVIDSGNGLQAFWRLDDPCENLPSIEAINLQLRDFFGGDSCQNIDRLMRVPGFVNYPNPEKRAAQRIERIAGWAAYDDGLIYAPEELRAAFPQVASRKVRPEHPSKDAPSADWGLITPDDLGLGPLDALRSAIEQPPGRDRSGDGLAVARLMANAKFADEQILGILLNPANAVSAHFLAQRDPRRSALRVINVVRRDDGQTSSTDKADAAAGEHVDTWPEPVDLWQHYEAPALPKGLLPPVIERFAFQQAEIMGVDPAGLAMSALAVCAGSIPDSIKLQVKANDPRWLESARLWVGLIGPPSVKKSPIYEKALYPLKKIDHALAVESQRQRAEFEALPTKEQKAAERPKNERRILSDTTVEAAQMVLQDSPRGVMLAQDELSGWFGQMDKYSGGKSDRAFWLQAFNGGSYDVQRVSRKAYIPNLSISLVGGIQPDVIRDLMKSALDDGLIQRIVPVVLVDGGLDQDLPDDGSVEAYNELVIKLNSLSMPRRADGGNLAQLEFNVLRFSSEAQEIRDASRIDFRNLVQALGSVSPKLSAHFGKYDGLFARLCVIWHCAEATITQPPPIIEADTARRVRAFIDQFIKPSAIAFYAGMLGMSAGHEDIVSLASLIVARGLSTVQPRDVQSAGQALRHVQANEVRTLCEKLEAFGWGQWGEPPRKSSTPRFLVNPLVHQRFADRGRQEQERRATARAIIHAALSR